MKKNSIAKIAALALYTFVLSSVYAKEVIDDKVVAAPEVVVELTPTPTPEITVKKTETVSTCSVNNISDFLVSYSKYEETEDPTYYKELADLIAQSYDVYRGEDETSDLVMISVFCNPVFVDELEEAELEPTAIPTPTEEPSKNSISKNAVSKNSISSNTASKNSASENTISKNSTSHDFSSVSWNGSILTKRKGVNYGPSGKETYYNLPMDGIIKMMRGMGNNDEHWIREDGVHMLGEYVMVAANLNLRPRGSIVETSLGLARVCDTGGFAEIDPNQIDIATTW